MKLIFFKRRYILWLSILGVLIIVSILLIDNSLNKISNRHRVRESQANDDDDDDDKSQASKYLVSFLNLKTF